MTPPAGAGGLALARAVDLGLGLSALTWAVLGPLRAEPEDRFTPVRLGISALHLAVAVLALRRCPPAALGTPRQILAALPSLLVSGAALRCAAPPHAWPWPVQAAFLMAIAWVIACFAALGRSFAILPARRGLVTRGPFGVVRHPAYLGELALLAACGATGGPPAMLLLGLAVPLVALRIAAEERLLAGDPGWDAYRARVGWRLVPGVW